MRRASPGLRPWIWGDQQLLRLATPRGPCCIQREHRMVCLIWGPHFGCKRGGDNFNAGAARKDVHLPMR
jgi:hypothetical protein